MVLWMLHFIPLLERNSNNMSTDSEDNEDKRMFFERSSEDHEEQITKYPSKKVA